MSKIMFTKVFILGLLCFSSSQVFGEASYVKPGQSAVWGGATMGVNNLSQKDALSFGAEYINKGDWAISVGRSSVKDPNADLTLSFLSLGFSKKLMNESESFPVSLEAGVSLGSPSASGSAVSGLSTSGSSVGFSLSALKTFAIQQNSRIVASTSVANITQSVKFADSSTNSVTNSNGTFVQLSGVGILDINPSWSALGFAGLTMGSQPALLTFGVGMLYTL
jgi:hypothetical protein